MEAYAQSIRGAAARAIRAPCVFNPFRSPATRRSIAKTTALYGAFVFILDLNCVFRFQLVLILSCFILFARLRCFSALRTSAAWRRVKHLSRPSIAISASLAPAWLTHMHLSNAATFTRILLIVLARRRPPTNCVSAPKAVNARRRLLVPEFNIPPQLSQSAWSFPTRPDCMTSLYPPYYQMIPSTRSVIIRSRHRHF